MTSRPRLLVIQWLRKPGEAERRALLTAIGPTPTEARLVRGERGMVEIFYDDPAAVVEVGDTIAATTKQNARTPTSDTLQLLKRGVLPSDAPERLRLSGRNESLIYLDKRSLELQVATDPIGFSKVFFVEQDGVRLFSSEIATLTPLASGTDESSVVSFILNGAPLAGRTIFKGISILRRGNIHRFGLDRVSRERYWDYCPDKTRAADGKAADLEAMLFDTIVDAIRTQCEGKRVILPLSGGFDSSFILGVLAKVLKHPDVVCFSYTNGPAGAGSDADVAKRQATLFGYPHLDLDISGTSLVSILELNREAGQSQRAPCLEIAAYANLRQLVGDDKDAIMPFGDEFFGGGWSSYAVAKDEDVLGAVYLRSPDGLDWLEEYAIPDNVPMLKEQLREDYTALKEKMQKFPDLNRARDYIYLDYRISMNLLPLRTFSVAHWFDVCAPLLDIKVLDGLSLLAHGQRADKTFFKAMAKKFLPEVFSHVRSSHRQVLPELRSKIVRDRDALIRMAEREHWQIPGLIDARGVQRLIRSSAARGVAGAPARNRLEDQGRKLLSSLGILEKAKRLRYRYLNPFEERLDYATVLTRVLSLAQQASESGRA